MGNSVKFCLANSRLPADLSTKSRLLGVTNDPIGPFEQISKEDVYTIVLTDYHTLKFGACAPTA